MDFVNDGTLTSVAVYRLDLESLTWTRVDSIRGDRAFLISGRYGFSVPVRPGAGGLIPQGNCVYFVLSGCDCERLYKFCLDDNTTSFHQILRNLPSLGAEHSGLFRRCTCPRWWKKRDCC